LKGEKSMDIGSGIAIGSGVIGTVAVIFKIFPTKNGNGNGLPCKDHSGVCEAIDGIQTMLTEVRQDIKHLLERP
jgi:hypothetical protein